MEYTIVFEPPGLEDTIRLFGNTRSLHHEGKYVALPDYGIVYIFDEVLYHDVMFGQIMNTQRIRPEELTYSSVDAGYIYVEGRRIDLLEHSDLIRNQCPHIGGTVTGARNEVQNAIQRRLFP